MTKMNGKLASIGHESSGGRNVKINSAEFRAHCARFLQSKGDRPLSMREVISLHSAHGKAAR